ncbi:MAG TPA: PfkB family carbohydrate kinase [Candidatus Omnitrophota bacterium]|nr:PfkB family carbohydrate kinase [Candidatus Omnitrophota bacterium]HPT07484.1 PfkB family carbohydrate kinase [Candidatus Omnitrophota bacterium]
MGILVLGTVALDTVQTPFGKRDALLGGSASHFSMSARLFTDVSLVAVIGKDFPDKHIAFLKNKGIDLTSLAKESGDTFRWQGEYSGDLNTAKTLDTHLGVLATFRPQLTAAQRRFKNVFLANVDPDIQNYLLASMRNSTIVGLDSMNFWIHTKRKSLLRALKKVDIFVANDQEARDLTGQTNLIKAAKSLRSYGPRIVLIKKGEHGVFLQADSCTLLLPAYPTDTVVDPTGAGDTFAGGFMGYLARAGKVNAATLKKAICYGTIAASFNVEGFGLEKTSALARNDLEKRLRVFKRHISI